MEDKISYQKALEDTVDEILNDHFFPKRIEYSG